MIRLEMEGATKAVVGLSVSAILIATLGVTAIGNVENASTAGFSTATLAVWGVMGVIIVIAFFLLILKHAEVV